MGKLSCTLVRSFCPTSGYAITEILTKVVTNFIIRLQTLWFLCSLLFPFVEVCEEPNVLREKPQDSFFFFSDPSTGRIIIANSDQLKSETSSVSCIALEFDARGLEFNPDFG